MTDAAAHHCAEELDEEQKPSSREELISPADGLYLQNFKSSGQSCLLSFFFFFFTSVKEGRSLGKAE